MKKRLIQLHIWKASLSNNLLHMHVRTELRRVLPVLISYFYLHILRIYTLRHFKDFII